MAPHQAGTLVLMSRRRVTVLAAVTAALLASSSVTEAGGPIFHSSQSVLELTHQEFEQLVLKAPPAERTRWLMLYYADWCPHCIDFAPRYECVAEALETRKDIRLGAVDCAVNATFCRDLDVQMYPTMRAYDFEEFADSTRQPKGHTVKIQPELEQLTDWRGWLLDHLPHGDADRPAVENCDKAAAPVGERSRWSPDDAGKLRFADADLAIALSFRLGVLPAMANSEKSGKLSLQGEKLAEFFRWLRYLAAVYPNSKLCQELENFLEAASAASNEEGGELTEHAMWALLNAHIKAIDTKRTRFPVDEHSRICRTYSCVLWTLFHILTVAVASQPAPKATDDVVAKHVSATWSVANGRRPALQLSDGPGDTEATARDSALPRIRGFVANFFECDDCRKHFTETYDSCALGRCQLAAEDHKGEALWLWQVHNEVTARVAEERGRQTRKWPTQAQCGSCWEAKDGKAWNADAVFDTLVQSYSQPAASSSWASDDVGGLAVKLGVAALFAATCVLPCLSDWCPWQFRARFGGVRPATNDDGPLEMGSMSP
eukprot:TRINITY_DN6609_c0_g1_i1.p1 TRINITY_DN6609_c0_g1~~TRINITY_DN6609_c0_g1_i1.p1  ORF type:complete len:546 (+),score=76.24 TRINITY_DN6609_c0_g1_i1:76-1713(+)